MLKITYTAYGRDFLRVTNFSEDQARFALEQICETVTSINVTKLRSNSKLIKTGITLESDVNGLMEQEKGLRDIFFIQ